MNEPVRLFLVSPAVAIRRALASSLDREAEILVVGEARSAVDALARAAGESGDAATAAALVEQADERMIAASHFVSERDRVDAVAARRARA